MRENRGVRKSRVSSTEKSHSEAEKVLKGIDQFLKALQKKHSLTKEEVLGQLKYGVAAYVDLEPEAPAHTIPIAIFDNEKLGSLETVVKYLKEERGMSFSRIAEMLNRSSKTIWTTYSNSSKKLPEPLSIVESLQNEEKIKILNKKADGEALIRITIPLSIFKNRKHSMLESLVRFLREHQNLSYSQIATLINRDQRTVWTVYNRAIKKDEVKSE